MPRPPTIALVASRSQRTGPTSPLLALIRSLEPWFRHVLQPRILAVGGSHAALRRYGVLDDYPGLEALPAGRDGGLVSLAARLVDPDPAQTVDWVIYLMDPTDPTTLYPESQAVKRECVVNAKPFLATAAAAREWCTTHWLAAADSQADGPADQRLLPRDLAAALFRDNPDGDTDGSLNGTIALIAHDSRKADMVQFAGDHTGLLGRFDRRLATGTTGSLLNGTIPDRLRHGWQEAEREAALYQAIGAPPERLTRRLAERTATESLVAALRSRVDSTADAAPWVTALCSGPKGGDGQIAGEVLAGRCRRVVFFEDPHVAREHEADIQLLERAARIRTDDSLCLHDPATARRWAEAWDRCLAHPRRVPVTLEQAFRRRFQATLVVANGSIAATLAAIRRGLAAERQNAPPLLLEGDPPQPGSVAVLTAAQALATLERAAAKPDTAPAPIAVAASTGTVTP